MLLEIVGWTGSTLLILSLLQQRAVSLRVLNAVGASILVLYNGALGVWPGVALNAAAVVVNVIQLIRTTRQQRDASDNRPSL